MSYIDPKNIKEAYEETKTHMRQFVQPFEEFERIARNKPSAKIPSNLPKTTDGTLSGIVHEQPKRVIQKSPSGIVRCNSYPELAEVAGYVLTDELLPQVKTQGSIIQKSWIMATKTLTYGMQASYSYFTKTGERFHMDFTIPYIKDILIEKGKVYGPDSNIEFLRGWYTKNDLKSIIDSEEKLQKKYKNYKSDWNIPQLKKLCNENPVSSKEHQTPAEREKGVSGGGIEIIHAFQKGIGEKFYSFSPILDNKLPLRTKVNNDPRGETPLDYFYCNIDLSNPYGRGAVEQSGGLQNLLDQQTQMFQFMTTLMMGPPIQVWGNVNKNTIKHYPNKIWDMGTQATNRAEPVTISNSSINNFPQTYGLIKSQILNQNSSLDTSVSAESGNPGFSKTPAGVNANEARLSISDNYMRKQFEKWFGDTSETFLNIYFSEKEGKDELEIPIDKLSKMSIDTLQNYFDKDKKKLVIPYGKIKEETFKFEVDAGSSEVKEKADNAEKLTEALRIGQNLLSDDEKRNVFRHLLKEIGVEGVDQILPDPTSVAGMIRQNELQQGQGNQPALAPQQVPNTPPVQGAVPQDNAQYAGGTLPQPGMPAPAMPQPGTAPELPPQQVPPVEPDIQADPDDEAFIAALQARGVPQDVIMKVQQLVQLGYEPEEILQELGA